MKHGNRYAKYRKYQCKDCEHVFTAAKENSSRYDSLALQAKTAFEYLLNRSLRKVRTSQAVGKIKKDKILEIVLSVARRLPELYEINQGVVLQWSGRFAVDATFISFQGRKIAVLIMSDFVSLDVVDYYVAEFENYYSWKKFLTIAIKRNNLKEFVQFFTSDGKKGLHKALSEMFPDVPVQLCKTHKLRRIHQILPHIQGDGYDQLFARLAQLAINAPIKAAFEAYLDILVRFKTSTEFHTYPESRQNKLKKVIGALRFQKSKLHAKYDNPKLIRDDVTTNHLEGINSFLKERLKLMKGIKNPDNLHLYVKILIYYYRFHKFTSSKFKTRNGKSPISLNVLTNKEELTRIYKGGQPYNWIINLLPSP